MLISCRALALRTAAVRFKHGLGKLVAPSWRVPANAVMNPPVDDQTPPAPARTLGDRWVYVLLGALLLFHVANNLYWTAADNRLIRVDEAYHIEKAANFYVLFARNDALSLYEKLAEFAGARMPYPPLAHVVGALFSAVLGYSPDHVALSSTLVLVLSILGLYAVARQFLPRGPALYAAFVASFIPLIFGLSRLFSLDFFSVPIVVWGIYALLRSENFTHIRWVVLFGVLNGLGFLAKQTTFAFLLCPAAFLLFAGMWQGLKYRAPGTGRLRAVSPYVRNGAVAILISFLTFGWWYVPQASAMYRWWSTQSMHGQGFLVGGVDKALGQLLDSDEGEVEGALGVPHEADTTAGTDDDLSEDDDAPAALPAPVAAPAAPAAKPEPEPYRITLSGLLRPFVERWDAYVVYAINDVLFLPTFVLGLLGLIALRHRRNRTVKALVPWVWVFGAYLVMTWLFESKTPRYLAPVAPAFGILCTWALYQIPLVRVRQGAMLVFAAVLLFQYGNLTWFSYGEYARKEIPVFQSNNSVKWTVNNGLTVYKDLIVTGVYVIRPPVRGENSADRILSGIALYERRFPPDGNMTTRYRLVSRMSGQPGFSLVERHYGPEGNPVRPVNAGPGYDSPRYLEQITPEVRNPQQAMDRINETNYIVLKPGDGDEVDRRLMQWVAAFRPYGFQTIDHFYEPGYGKYWSSWYHVLARRPPVTLETARDIFDLCELKSYPAESPFVVPPRRRGELERRIYQERLARQGQEVPFSDELKVLTIQVVSVAPGWYQIRIAFEVLKDLNNDYRVYVHASVTDDNREKVPLRFRKDRIIQWNFNPDPPTSQWKAGQIIALRRDVMAEPIPYHLAIGMTGPTGNIYGNRISAGWVDFSKVGPPLDAPLPSQRPAL